jgi:hypothetical protein
MTLSDKKPSWKERDQKRNKIKRKKTMLRHRKGNY